jgi:hypothetical protein
MTVDDPSIDAEQVKADCEQALGIDGPKLNALFDDWKAEVYASFPGAQVIDACARNEEARTAKFVGIAAFVEERKILALWSAEVAPAADGRRSVSIAARTLEEPTDPEALPDPFRTLAVAAFNR